MLVEFNPNLVEPGQATVEANPDGVAFSTAMAESAQKLVETESNLDELYRIMPQPCDRRTCGRNLAALYMEPKVHNG